jgi:hypothetical protein
MYGWLAARELHYFRESFGGHEVVQNTFNFSQCEIKTSACIGVAERTVHVAGAIDFNYAHASMLLVVGAEPAVVGATMNDLSGKLQGDGSGLVEPGLFGISLGITIDQGFKLPVIGTTFVHKDFIVAQQNSSVDNPATYRANAPS